MSILGQTSVMNISGLVCLSPASMKVQQPRLLVMNSAWPWNRAALQGQPTGHIACTFQAYSHTASFSHHRPSPTPEFFFFFFCSVGSSFLHPGFLWLWQAVATLHCSMQASHCTGFSCCRAQASVVVAGGLSCPEA